MYVVIAVSRYRTYVVFHDSGYDVFDPRTCQSIGHVGAQFDLAARRSTRLQLTSGSGHVTSALCGARCGWGGAVVVNNELIYVSQPRLLRVIVIDVKQSHRPVEVSRQ